VGKELRDDALIAILFSAIGMILYIAWRFEFSFGSPRPSPLFTTLWPFWGSFISWAKR